MDRGPAIDPKRLLVYREVVRAGSISGGARLLGWTQPAVSQHLTALERSVGMPLLLRSTKGVEPTEPGRALLAHADAVAARLEDARAEIEGFADRAVGRVRVAAFPSGAAVLLPPAMRRLADQHPGLRVDLTEAEPPEALDLVRAGEADVALTFDYGPREQQEADVVTTPVGSDEVRLVLPVDHEDGQRPRDLDEFAGAAWIAGCERCRAHLLTTAARAGFDPDIRHVTDDYVLVQSLVAQGLGVALLPTAALSAHQHPGVRAVPTTGAGPRRHHIAHRPGAQHVPAVSTVVAALRSTTST